MASYGEVFKRVEKKYRVNADQRRAVERVLALRMEPDKYGCTQVTSVYFDTPDDALIERSLEKPLYKEKLRLRAYGAENGRALANVFAGGAANEAVASSSDAANVPVFFEIKKKFKGVVYKRRVELSLAAACAYAAGERFEEACAHFSLADEQAVCEVRSPRGMQIAREIDAMRVRYAPLMPVMVIACERVAWMPCAQHACELAELRVTFDGALAYRACAGAGADADAGAGVGTSARTLRALGWSNVLAPGESIMEVKSVGALPLWLSHALAGFRVYPASFSKYGAAHILQLKGGRCA